MYFPSSTSSLLLLGFTLSHLPTPINSQKVNPDAIDFRELSDFNDQRVCVQTCFYECLSGVCYNKVADEIGCKTNKCLCSGQTFFELGLEAAEKCTEKCKVVTVEDAEAAKKLLTDYCDMKGYTIDSNSDSDLSLDSSSSSETSSTTSSPTQTQQTVPSTTTSSNNNNDSNNNPTSNPSTTSTTSSDSTETSSSSNEDDTQATKSSKGLSMPEIIGIVVGIASLFVAILTLWITWKKRKEKGAAAAAAAKTADEDAESGVEKNNHNVNEYELRPLQNNQQTQQQQGNNIYNYNYNYAANH